MLLRKGVYFLLVISLVCLSFLFKNIYTSQASQLLTRKNIETVTLAPPSKSDEVLLESYQIALMLDLWYAWSKQDNPKYGSLSFSVLEERQERFRKKHLNRYLKSLAGKKLKRKEKDEIVAEVRDGIDAHAIIPDSIYVREDGRISGWFSDPETGIPTVIEVRAQPLITTVWPSPVEFVRDFAREENLTPFVMKWLYSSGVPVSEYASDLSESPLIAPSRSIIPLKELQKISLDKDYEIIHETKPALITPVERPMSLKDKIDAESKVALEKALKTIKEYKIFSQLGINTRVDLSKKKLTFVHHEDLMNISSYRASWIYPDEPHTIYISYEFWRVLREPERVTLLTREITKGEALKAWKDIDKADEASTKAALVIDPGKILNRWLEDILKDYRIYNGVDRIELIITHPHGDHSSYVSNYVRGKMQKNLVARPVPPLTEKLKLELGNKFTHEVTSYLLRPTKRVVTVFDMGGYKGEGADPFIETVNPHYRIRNKHFMKPVTIYADRQTAQTLDFQKKVETWKKDGIQVDLKIFESDIHSMVLTDSDYNRIGITAYRAYHLPNEVGSSIYVLKKLDKDGKIISSFSLVSEIGDSFPYSASIETVEDIAVSDVIAIDGTNFSAPLTVSPVPVRFQDNKIHQVTDRMNRSWSMISHLNTTLVGSVAEALEASKTLDRDIPIIVFAGKDGIKNLTRAYEKNKEGKSVLRKMGDIYYINSASIRKESRGAKIYFVNSMKQFYLAWKSKKSKEIHLKNVMRKRLRQLYSSGRNAIEAGEYLEDWAKNPGLSENEFMWLLDELQNGNWDIFQKDDVVNSFSNRISQVIRDYFSDLRDYKREYVGNPEAGKWVMNRLLDSIESYTEERRGEWMRKKKKKIPEVLKKDMMKYLAYAVKFLGKDDKRKILLTLSERLNRIDSLSVETKDQSRKQVAKDTIKALCDTVKQIGTENDMPKDLTHQIITDIKQRLAHKTTAWSHYQVRHIPFLFLEDIQKYIDKMAGKSDWSIDDTKKLLTKINRQLNIHRQSGSGISDHIRKKVLHRMLKQGAVPSNEKNREKIMKLLISLGREDPRCITGLIKIFQRDTPALNKSIARTLLRNKDGKMEKFDVRIENIHKATKTGLSKFTAQEILEAWSAHSWDKPEYEIQWIETLLDKCLVATKKKKKWIGLDRDDMVRQLLYAVNHCDMARWSSEQINVLFEKIFDVQDLPPDDWREIMLQYIAAVPDIQTKKSLIDYFGSIDKKDFRKYERRKKMRDKEEDSLQAIETALWELAKTDQGKVLIIGIGHFASNQQKATQLLDKIFDMRYAEVLIEGRPRIHGRQGRISGQLITREKMALLGKYRPIRVRHEHQWMSGHITYEESVKLLELIYNARVRLGLVDPGSPKIPSRGVDRLTPADIDKYKEMPMRVLFTTSSKLMTPKNKDDEVGMTINIGEDKRRIIEILGELFDDLEVGAGRKTIRIGKGTWQSKDYARPISRSGSYLRELYDRATKGQLAADLSNLVGSKKPADYAADFAKLEKKAPKDMYRRLKQIEKYFESQILRLGLRVVLKYGSQKVIEEEEIGSFPKDPDKEKQFAQLPPQSKGLYFQLTDAIMQKVKSSLDEDVLQYVKNGMDRYFDRPPYLFDQDGKITSSLRMLVKRYTEPGFAKTAVWIDPIKSWATKQGLNFYVDLPKTRYESGLLFRFLRVHSIDDMYKMAKITNTTLKKVGRKKDFIVEINGFKLERKGNMLTLLLTSEPSVRIPQIDTRQTKAVGESS